jgi:PilZ domain
MPLAQHCSAEKCSRAAAVALDGQSFCAEHFVLAAYRFLDDVAAQLHHAPQLGPSTKELARRLSDCTRGTTSLAMSSAKTDNLARARLIDILLWASELLKQVRRGPRVDLAVPVVLAGSAGDRVWEEATTTLTVSQHGASLCCRRALALGDVVKIKHANTGKQGTARVVWSSRKDAGTFEIGLELLNEQNLWGVDWDLVGRHRGGVGSASEAV